MKNVAVLGYGTVGSGVVEVIRTNQEVVNKKAGDDINIKYVLDLRTFPGDPVEEILVNDFEVILNDPEVEVIAEVMGGVEPAYTFVKKALLKGKSVCTSNKELVAKHGPELIEIARKMNRNFFFEASVGGGIPIIRPLISSLTADEIVEVSGILNGTTNFILTKMSKEGLDFDTVLKEAQALGYAEKDPTADVEGHDASRKIAILTSLVFGKTANFEEVYTEGITKITDKDFMYANKLGMSIKIFGRMKKVGNDIYAMVSPVMIDESNPLYSVNGVMNAILVKGNVLGEAMFYGAGAGKLPTASAVVSDIVEAVKHLNDNVEIQWDAEKLALSDIKTSEKKFFVRVGGETSKDFANIEKEFGKVVMIKLESLTDEFAFVTEKMSEADFESKISKISNVKTRIRIEGH